MNSKEVSSEFSKGNFSFAYDYFTENIVWNIVGGKKISGKSEVIAYCDQMMKEMSGTLTNTNIIVEDSRVAIEGFCNYIDEQDTEAKVEYCDVYTFQNEKLGTITSYCIDIKNKH